MRANPTALSVRKQHVIVSPEVEQALVLWVKDMLANNHVTSSSHRLLDINWLCHTLIPTCLG